MHRRITLMGMILLAAILLILPGCLTQTMTTTVTVTTTMTTTTTTTIPMTTTPTTYSLPELKYRLLAYFDDFFWCDPHLWPIPREEQEQQDALEQFPAIRADEAEFAAILKYLYLSNKSDYTDEEKLLIFRQHKKLTYALQVTPVGDVYRFTIRVGEGQGETIEGEITTSGEITITKREPSINSCPICLAPGTLIDTPQGMVPVELIDQGTVVWTLDGAGNRVASTVVKAAKTLVPLEFELVRLELDDGRSVTASPGHPSADGRALGDYRLNDGLDGSIVVAIRRIDYQGMTYDILPAGATGVYWASGILLRSTLE